MNTKQVTIISTLLLTANLSIANAESIRLSNRQMDNVSAGADYNLSQSASSSQSILNGTSLQYNLQASAQGESSTAYASALLLGAVSDNTLPAPMDLSLLIVIQ